MTDPNTEDDTPELRSQLARLIREASERLDSALEIAGELTNRQPDRGRFEEFAVLWRRLEAIAVLLSDGVPEGLRDVVVETKLGSPAEDATKS